MRTAQGLRPSRGEVTEVSTDASAAPAFEVEVAVAAFGVPGRSKAADVLPLADPVATASTPPGLIEDTGSVDGVNIVVSTANVDARAQAGDDPAAPISSNASVRPEFVSSVSPAAPAGDAAPVTAASVEGPRSFPLATQVAETVRAAVLRGDHEVRLLLNPGDLGRIDIRITERDGVLRLQLDASHGATRDLLTREMPALQHALEARDLRVERIQVSHSGSASADGSGAAWQGSGRGQQQEPDGSPAWSPVAHLEGSRPGTQVAPRAPRVIPHGGVLDRVA